MEIIKAGLELLLVVSKLKKVVVKLLRLNLKCFVSVALTLSSPPHGGNIISSFDNHHDCSKEVAYMIKNK